MPGRGRTLLDRLLPCPPGDTVSAMEPLISGRGGRVRVLLIGDDPLARSGLAALLAAEPGIAIVAQSAPGEDAAAAVAEHDPDVILWDLGPRPASPLELPGTTSE